MSYSAPQLTSSRSFVCFISFVVGGARENGSMAAELLDILHPYHSDHPSKGFRVENDCGPCSPIIIRQKSYLFLFPDNRMDG